jgi:hypothetical protein
MVEGNLQQLLTLARRQTRISRRSGVTPVLQLTGVDKTYRSDDEQVNVLITFEFILALANSSP